MHISSENTLTDTPRNNVLPAIWESFSPVKLAHKINHHNVIIDDFKIIYYHSFHYNSSLTQEPYNIAIFLLSFGSPALWLENEVHSISTFKVHLGFWKRHIFDKIC